jgi:hypothetical protein
MEAVVDDVVGDVRHAHFSVSRRGSRVTRDMAVADRWQRGRGW